MNCVNHLVTESLPGYLKGLPIPNTVCNLYNIREGLKKKSGKIVPFCQTRGGSKKEKKRQTSILEKYFFSEHVESF